MKDPSLDSVHPLPRAEQAPIPSDEQIVERVLSGDTSLFEILMRRNNQRLFRIVRAMVPNDSEAEDVLQETYVRAYQQLRQFEGRARFSTWLTRIAIHEVMARQRRRRRFTSLEEHGRRFELAHSGQAGDRTPEERASSSELRGILERAIQQMPESLRLVFMLREVDGLGTDEAADCLGISAANVKVRLHRARSLLRSTIDRQVGADVRQLHQFAGEQCDDVVARVLSRIRSSRKETEA